MGRAARRGRHRRCRAARDRDRPEAPVARRCRDRRQHPRRRPRQCARRAARVFRSAKGHRVSQLTSNTIAELRDGIRSGEFSAREVAEAYNAAVAAARTLNAYTVETPEDALAAAEAADKSRGNGDLPRLAGIPLGIKGLFATRGVDTAAGSRILKDFRPPYESSVTANLRKAGAGMLGKLNMDEFAMGSSNETSAYGPVISPWRRKGSNVGLTPGGSSGGSAAAVAAGLAPAATGTDTGGSIRQPAAFTGITGIKPTYGRCSRWGIVAFASSLDQAGPMAKSVRDCAILLEAMAGFDPKDSTSLDLPVPTWEANLSSDLRDKRVGIPRNIGSTECPARSTRCGAAGSSGSRTPAPCRSRSACHTRSTRCRPITSSPRRRRRRISPAMTGCGTACAKRA